MAHRNVRRSVAVLALAASVLTVAGCDVVKQGAKCRNGAAPGRDATHVLFCQGGKWKRVMTIGQAADFIMSTWPSNVELLEGGGQTTGVGEPFGQVVVRVTRKDGQPVKGADVVFRGPDSGAGLAAPSGLIATDANGVARFTPVANSQLGGYAVSATVNGGTSPYVVFGLNNGAAPASSIVVVSGAGQSAAAGTQFAPVGVKAVDRFGNVVQYKNFEFSSPVAGVWFGPAQAFAGEDGIATTTIGTGNAAGTVPVTVKVVGTDTATTFNLTVVAGPVASAIYTGDGNAYNNSLDPHRLDNPLNVFLLDSFGNRVVNAPVVFTIVPVDSGSGGTFDATGTSSATILAGDDGIASARLHDNGSRGRFHVVAAFDSAFHCGTHTFSVNGAPAVDPDTDGVCS